MGTAGIPDRWTVGAYMVWLVSVRLRARVTESVEEHSCCWTSFPPLHYMSGMGHTTWFVPCSLCFVFTWPFSCYILPITLTFGRFGGEELRYCNLPSCRAFSFSDNCFFSPRTGSVSPLVIFYGTQQMTKQPHHSPYHSRDNKPLPCSITALLL